MFKDAGILFWLNAFFVLWVFGGFLFICLCGKVSANFFNFPITYCMKLEKAGFLFFP